MIHEKFRWVDCGAPPGYVIERWPATEKSAVAYSVLLVKLKKLTRIIYKILWQVLGWPVNPDRRKIDFKIRISHDFNLVFGVEGFGDELITPHPAQNVRNNKAVIEKARRKLSHEFLNRIDDVSSYSLLREFFKSSIPMKGVPRLVNLDSLSRCRRARILLADKGYDQNWSTSFA